MTAAAGRDRPGHGDGLLGRAARMQAALDRLGPWRRRATGIALGALAAGALPPFYLVFLLVPAFTGLAWLTAGARRGRAAFGAGWWFGLGHHLAGLYWVANAFVVYADRHAVFAPFAVAGLAAGMAVFSGAATWLAWRLSGGRVARVGGVLVFAGAWTAAEWLRAWLFTGFPWNLIGTAWTFSDGMLQTGAFGGVYLAGLLSVLAAAMPAALSSDRDAGPVRPWAAVTCGFLLLAGVWFAGVVRLLGVEQAFVEGVTLRLVQPAIAQRDKWKPALRREHVLRQLAMSRGTLAEGDRHVVAPGAADAPSHILWSETAVPFLLNVDPVLRSAIGSVTPEGGATVTGALRSEGEGEQSRIWNSLSAVDAQGEVAATYDKAHLVPFGEYVPFRNVLPVDKLTPGARDFSAGPGLRTIRIPGAPPVGPLICYEVIFPADVVDREDRPAWILNLTNDAWYGMSTGPYQHFATARWRAVEEGLPVVRVANTGISGVIDGYGRIVASMALGRSGIVDSGLPVGPERPPPFARGGVALAGALVVTVAVFGVWLVRRGSRPGANASGAG